MPMSPPCSWHRWVKESIGRKPPKVMYVLNRQAYVRPQRKIEAKLTASFLTFSFKDKNDV